MRSKCWVWSPSGRGCRHPGRREERGKPPPGPTSECAQNSEAAREELQQVLLLLPLPHSDGKDTRHPPPLALSHSTGSGYSSPPDSCRTWREPTIWTTLECRDS